MDNQILAVIVSVVLVVLLVIIPFSVLSLSSEKKKELAKKSIWAKCAIYFSFPFIMFGEILGTMFTSVIFIFLR